MADPIEFEGCNLRLGPPVGMTEEEVRSMSVYKGNGQVVSCWKLRPEELEEVVKTGCVWLSIFTEGVPPSFVGSETTVLELLFPSSNISSDND